MPRLILLTTNLARGGAEAQVAALAARLLRYGWETAVVSLLPPTAFEEDLRQAGVQVYSLGMRPGVPGPRGVARLLSVLRRCRPQVLHSHMFHANVLARAARLVCPVPVVISTLHSDAETGRASRRLWLRDDAYRITDWLADAVVAVSESAAERHASARAVPRRKLSVIPNGVDTAAFRPDPDLRARTRREFAFEREFVWLAVGRLMWKKDYPTLLRAFCRLRGAVLLIAGEGPDEAELRACACSLGAEVRFLGPRGDIPSLMNAADGLVLSSAVEGLPMVLLEGAACGLPAVATGVGGVREVVAGGETGFVVPPGDPDALGAAMEQLAALPAGRREQMSRAARAQAVARFDLDEVAAQWDRTYRALLEQGSRLCPPERPWTCRTGSSSISPASSPARTPAPPSSTTAAARAPWSRPDVPPA